MSTTKIMVSEGDLLNVLYDISPLEWRRFQQRHPQVWNGKDLVVEDRSNFPPWVSFRFESSDDVILKKLSHAIDSYSGKIRWSLNEHKREGLPGSNWTIGPRRLFEVKDQASKLDLSPGQYLAQYEPEFGPIAYEDLVGLTEYIRQLFM